jgi:pimeloyl-ACP methyl ester carboxylesterase
VDRVVEHRGCRLAYSVEGAGPAVLFIQGVGVQGRAWRPQTTELADAYTCIWFDNRGMGRSQPVGAGITVARMADDARAILDAERVGAAHVAGHSLGGPVALRLALDAREHEGERRRTEHASVAGPLVPVGRDLGRGGRELRDIQ